MTLETWLPSDVMSLRLWPLARKMTALANSFSSALITAFDSQSGKKKEFVRHAYLKKGRVSW